MNVDVHIYKSRLFTKKFNIAADRSVTVKERGIECIIYERLVSIELNAEGKKVRKKKWRFPGVKKTRLEELSVILIMMKKCFWLDNFNLSKS